MDNIFTELSLTIIIATGVAAIMYLLRQPLIIGHIITGLIVGPYFLGILKSTETIEVFSQLGIALLLFIVGLSLSPKVIREVGKISLITGLGQVIFTLLIGFWLCRLFGFSTVESLYIATALTFSSTIIILKLLSDKKDLNRLYGKISIGFLLVQDIVATIILIGVSSLAQGGDLTTLALQATLKGAAALAILFAVTVYILPALTNFLAKSQEFLFLFSISWGLGMAVLFKYLGFSVEIGALAAGAALAMSPYHYEISARMRPLRDFFIVLFFILLGSHMTLSDLGTYIVPAILLSLFIFIGNPIIVMTLMGLLGYNKKTGFKAGLTVAQISEFSLILVTMGSRVGHLSESIVSLVTLVGLITIAGSAYMILYSDKLYTIFSPILSIFERKSTNPDKTGDETYEVILFGLDSVGSDFITSFKKLKKEFLVIDYNPEVIQQLEEEKVNCRYGDANDNEFLDELKVQGLKMAISTILDHDTSQLIISHIRRTSKKTIIIVKAETVAEADSLYKMGATYVMMPHYITSDYTTSLIDKHGFDFSKFLKERDRHIAYLKKRQKSAKN